MSQENSMPTPNPRLRILELPMEHAGEWSAAPFVFVLDRAGEQAEETLEALGESGKAMGAVGALIFDMEVDLE